LRSVTIKFFPKLEKLLQKENIKILTFKLNWSDIISLLPIIIIGVWIFYNEKNVSGGAGGEDKFSTSVNLKLSLTKNRC
jgi:hypothetical protein